VNNLSDFANFGELQFFLGGGGKRESAPQAPKTLATPPEIEIKIGDFLQICPGSEPDQLGLCRIQLKPFRIVPDLDGFDAVLGPYSNTRNVVDQQVCHQLRIVSVHDNNNTQLVMYHMSMKTYYQNMKYLNRRCGQEGLSATV